MRSGARTVSMRRIFPIMALNGDVEVTRKGALTVGWEMTFPVAYSVGEREYDAMVETMAAAVAVFQPWTVVHRQDMYTYEDYAVDDEPGEGYLRRSDNRHFRGRRHLVHHAYVFATYGSKSLVEKPGRSSGLFGTGSLPPIPSPEAFAGFRLKAEQFERMLKGAGIGMRRLLERDWIGQGTSPGIVQRYFMLGSSSPVLSDVALRADSVGVHDKTAMIFNIAESRSLQTSVSNVVKVSGLSNVEGDVYLSTGSRIGLALKCEHCVNQVFVVPQQDEVKHELESTRKDMTSGISSTDNRVNAGGIQEFLDEDAVQKKYLVKTQTNLIVWGRDEERLELIGKATAALTEMAVDTNATSVFCRRNAPVVWYACAPGNAYEIGTESLMKMELTSALCLGSYETYERGLENGLLRVCDRLRNIPFRFDIQKAAQDAGLVENYNAFVLGSSGSGKSYTMNMILKDLYQSGESIFIIDKGDSYQGLCNIVREESGGRDGQYMHWDALNPLTFTFFQDYRSWFGADGSIDTENSTLEYILSSLQTLWVPEKGWTAQAEAVLRKIVTDFLLEMHRRNVQSPIFDDFHRYLQDEVQPRIQFVPRTEQEYLDMHRQEELRKMRQQEGFVFDESTMPLLDVEAKNWLATHKEEVRQCIWQEVMDSGFVLGTVQITLDMFNIKDFLTAMFPLTENGTYGRVFNSREPQDLLSSRFVVFEVESLSDENRTFYALCILAITHAFDVKMKKDVNGFKVLVIDEAWKAIANRTMAPYLQGLWKTARKYNASGVVVSQEVNDIVSSDVIKTAIIANSSVKILLQQDDHAGFRELAEMMALPERTRTQVMSLNRDRNPDVPFYKEACFILGDKLTLVAAMEGSAEDAMAFESNKNRKEDMVQLAENYGGSYIRAIDTLLKNRIEEDNRKNGKAV